MKKTENSFKVSQWIIRDLSGAITDDEREALGRWLNEDRANSKLYEEIRNELTGDKEEIIVDITTDWNVFVSKRKKSHFFRNIRKYAAVGSLLLALGGGIYLSFQKPTSKESVITTQVIPGSNRARLILADGQQVMLNGNDSVQQITENGGVKIVNQSGRISYEKTVNPNLNAVAYNTLEIPRGGEYSLVLSDGTKVWLNSKTELKYPLNFTGRQRVVELSGEAYFQVTHDAGHPFIVKTKVAEVKVYGTSFNICAYPEDSDFYTTLETGSVGVNHNGKSYMLQPGQQAVVNGDNETVELREVNTQTYCSWRNGSFIFEEERLEAILSRLSRWYDVEVFYQNESLKDLHFTGDLGRYEDFGKVLSFIEMTMKVKFVVKNRTIMVGARK